MFHKRENNTFKSCLIVEPSILDFFFFQFLLVNKAINTMPDSSGDFQRMHLARNRFLLWRSLDFLVSGSLTCQYVYKIVHIQLLYEVKLRKSNVLSRWYI